MHRRAFLAAAGSGLVVAIGATVSGCSVIPVIPARPEPDVTTALGWIAYRDGRYSLTVPRAEIGQNIATAMKQIACAELDVPWGDVDVALHDTTMDGVRATVGSESIMAFAEPLAQACATLREAVAEGRSTGEVVVAPRPVSQLRSMKMGGLIGQSPEIAQGREIVTGAPLYAADVNLPGMLHGRVLRAPASLEVASRPVGWNLDAARRVSGFVAVVEDCGPPIGKARGLGIVANRPGALDVIAEALEVEWHSDELHLSADICATIDVDARLSEGALPHNVLDGAPQPGTWEIDLRLEIPLAAHGPIEPRAAVAQWDDGALKLWAGTQDAFYVRDFLADALKINADDVVVQSSRVGGAFGGKAICVMEAEAAFLARFVGAPVKVQWTRMQEFALGFHRPPSSHRVRARLDDGRITDWSHDQVSSHILFTAAVVPSWMQAGTDLFVGDGGVARGMAAPYDLGRAHAAYDAIRLPVHTGAWRGLGAGPNVLAIESAMDEAARSAAADPVAFRLAHIRDPRLAGVLKLVADSAQWGAAPTPAAPGERTGRGLACGIYKEMSYAAAIADVAVGPDGVVRVTRIWCAHDCGLVINPDQVRAQCEGNLVWSIGLVLSDTLPVEEGHVIAQTFADAPIPRLKDVPPISVDLVQSEERSTGAGETAIVAGPGAIANAVRAATGIRLSSFPASPDQLKA